MEDPLSQLEVPTENHVSILSRVPKIVLVFCGIIFLFILTLFHLLASQKLQSYICNIESVNYAKNNLKLKLEVIKNNPSLDSIPQKTIPMYEQMIEKGQFFYMDYNPQYDSCLKRYNVQLSQAEKYDNSRARDFEDIRQVAMSYFKTNDDTPKSMEDIENASFPPVNVYDPKTRKPYSFRMITDEDAEVCMTFDTESPARIYKEFEERGVNEMWGAKLHKKGYQCKRMIVALGYKRKESLQNGDFGSWENYSYGSVPQYWHFSGNLYPALLEIGINDPISERPSGLVTILPSQTNARLISESFNVIGGSNYKFSVWVKSTDSCTNCGFLGFEIFNEYNESFQADNLMCDVKLLTLANNNQEIVYYSYIQPSKQITNEYTEYSYTCLIPKEVKRIKAVFGYISAPKQDWLFDNVSIKKL